METPARLSPRAPVRVWLRPLPGWAFPVLQVAAGLACAALCLAARRSRWPPRRLLLLVTGLACG